MKVLEVKDVKKQFINEGNHFNILKGISFDVEKGEFLSIIGPSGSGKSTLLSIIAGLDNPSSGSVKINSKEISNFTEDELAKIRNEEIGFVFQSFFLVPFQSNHSNTKPSTKKSKDNKTKNPNIQRGIKT